MPSAALRPKNPCQACLIEGWSVGVTDRPHPTTPASGGRTLLTLATSGRGPLLTLPRSQERVGREQAEGPSAHRPESTCHMHYFRRACGRWPKRHCGVPANPRTLGESDTSDGGVVSGPRGPLMIQGPPLPTFSRERARVRSIYPAPLAGEGRWGIRLHRMDRDTARPRHHGACAGNVEAGFT
jgi:hypothetical protein